MSFKVGDWVRIWDKPTRILRVVEANALHTEAEYYDTPSGFRDGCLNPKGLELWQPKEGEWCWFWNKDSEMPPVLRRFKQTQKDGAHITKDDCYFYDYCEPFIGTLPSFIKDKQ